MTDNLKPEQAAKWLQISVRTLLKHVADGELSYTDVGRGLHRKRRRFDMEALKAFKKRRRRTETACQSIAEPTVSLPSISSCEVFDFAARLASNRSAPPKTLSGKNASKPGNASP